MPLPAALAGRCVLLYSGNYGVAHEIDTVFEGYRRHHVSGTGRVVLWLSAAGAGATELEQRFGEVQHVVDEIKDADGKVLDRVTKQTGVLEVTQVLANSAIAKVVSGTAAQGDSVEAQ